MDGGGLLCHYKLTNELQTQTVAIHFKPLFQEDKVLNIDSSVTFICSDKPLSDDFQIK